MSISITVTVSDIALLDKLHAALRAALADTPVMAPAAAPVRAPVRPAPAPTAPAAPAAAPAKRGPGRPRKNPVPTPVVEDSDPLGLDDLGLEADEPPSLADLQSAVLAARKRLANDVGPIRELIQSYDIPSLEHLPAARRAEFIGDLETLG